MIKALSAVAAFLLLTLSVLSANMAYAQQTEDFTVAEIKLVGLDRVLPGTVLAFVGFDSGDVVDAEVLEATVGRLFDTGLFRDIEVYRDGDTVVINVSENPTINKIRFEGMVNLDPTQVLDLLESQDIANGRVFKRGNAGFIERTVSTFYRQTSRFLATAEVVPVPLEDNRVDLVVDITEGPAAVVERINFHGNQVFAEDDLHELFEIKEAGFINSIFDRDVYTQSGFEGDLDRLRRHYLNAGYIRFVILSTDVQVLPDAGSIEIDIFVSEGAQFRFAEAAFSTTNTTISPAAMQAAVSYQVGTVFSDKEVETTRMALRRLMRQQGHAFATVEVDTRIIDADLEVEVEYTLAAGKVVEVRNIEFIGNNITQDVVLRRQLELLEGETFAIDKLEYSLIRLRRNGYLRDARAFERPAGDDQVDIDIEVDEATRGAFLVGAGYSNTDGLSFKLDFSRNNILGTGNDFAFFVETDGDEHNFNIKLDTPGITDSGISRSVGIFYDVTESDSDDANVTDIDTTGIDLTYTIPYDRNWSWRVGAVVEHNRIHDHEVLLNAPTVPSDNRSSLYVDRFGDKQQFLRLVAGLGFDSRDRAFDTTEGIKFDALTEVAIPPSDVKYYKVRVRGDYYRPLDDERRSLFFAQSQLRYGNKYGNGIYPYYERFSISSGQLRGFDTSEIGPQGDDVAIAGLAAFNTTFELQRQMRIFGTEGVRGGAFVDIAGLWDPESGEKDEGEGLRSSAGLLLKIRTPVFPFALSYGIPLRKKKDDKLQKFQFRIGF